MAPVSRNKNFDPGSYVYEMLSSVIGIWSGGWKLGPLSQSPSPCPWDLKTKTATSWDPKRSSPNSRWPRVQSMIFPIHRSCGRAADMNAQNALHACHTATCPLLTGSTLTGSLLLADPSHPRAPANVVQPLGNRTGSGGVDGCLSVSFASSAAAGSARAQVQSLIPGQCSCQVAYGLDSHATLKFLSSAQLFKQLA